MKNYFSMLNLVTLLQIVWLSHSFENDIHLAKEPRLTYDALKIMVEKLTHHIAILIANLWTDLLGSKSLLMYLRYV